MMTPEIYPLPPETAIPVVCDGNRNLPMERARLRGIIEGLQQAKQIAVNSRSRRAAGAIDMMIAEVSLELEGVQ